MPTMARRFTLAACFLLGACGPPDSAELLRRADGITTKSALAAALGQPDEIGKLGPIETWTYRTSDGEVSFVLAGERVQLAAGGTRSP